MGLTTPPKENPIRRNARVGPTLLPPAGRKGPVPAWPLTRATPAERKAWTTVWRTPQAVVWERLGYVRTVARYCRILVLAEEPGATAALLGQVSNLEDKLGLTPKAMRMLLWQIAPDEVAEKRDERAANVRERLRAVEDAS